MKQLFYQYKEVFLVSPALFLYIYSSELNLIGQSGLVYRKLCLDQYNETICNSLKNHTDVSTRIQEKASENQIYLNVAFLLPAIISLIHLASLGDRRLNYKIPLIVSIIGSLLQSFICIFTPQLPADKCISLLIFAQFVNGICGAGSISFISSCFSHIAVNDSAKAGNPNSKSIRYSICESFLLLGQFLGSFSSGYVIGNKTNLINFTANYIISFSIYLAVFVYLILMFYAAKRFKKETNDSMNQNLISGSSQELNKPVIEVRNGSIIGYLKKQFIFIEEVWNMLKKRRANNARFHIFALLFIFFLGSSISMGIMSLQYLYLVKKPISLTQIEYGLFKALNTFFRFLSLIILFPLFKNYFQWPDYYLFILGTISELLNLIVFAFASLYSYLIWFAPISYMFSNYFVVCIRSFSNRLVDKHENGKFFALIGVVEFLVLLISSSIFSAIYKLTVATLPVVVFIIGIVICIFICFPLLIIEIRDLRKLELGQYVIDISNGNQDALHENNLFEVIK